MKPLKSCFRVGGQPLLAVLLACSGASCAASKTQLPAAAGETKGPAAHTVTRGPAKAKVQLDAVVEARGMHPLKLTTKVWTDLVVADVVAHGAQVKKGQALLKLETEKIEEQIEDFKQERPAAKVALELAQAELENLTQTTPNKLEAARRSQRVADEDYNYFVTTNRAQKEKSARFNVKSAEQRLENAEEELKQLEKMYQADDLTEETEEIVLKRQQFAVEAARFYLDSARLSLVRELETSIPREHENLQSQKRDQDLARALAEETLPNNLAKKRIEVEKLKRDQKKAEKKLADLQQDLEGLTLRAPVEGLVYYGACENGKWTTGAGVAKKLAPGSKLTPNEVLMTVVEPARLQLKAVVPENQLAQVKPGMKGEVSPVSAPDKKFAAKLEELGDVPLLAGGFEATLSMKPDKSLRLVPGMTCKVSFGETTKADVLRAPKAAVFTEGKESYVFVQKSDGTPERRTVKTAELDDKMVEIVQGLAEGDKILLKKPE